MPRLSVNVTPDEMLMAIADSLRELNQIDEFLMEYGIEYPLGRRGVEDMHAQLAGRLEEARADLVKSRDVQAAQLAYIKDLEDVILGADDTHASDTVRFYAAKIRDRRKAREAAEEAGE